MHTFFLSILLFSLSIATQGQAIEDVLKLGLTQSQLNTSFEKRTLLLTHTSTGKKKKIKEGAYATIRLKHDTTQIEGFLEAFLTDSVIVSTYASHLGEEETKAGFTGYRLIPLEDIERLTYSVKHQERTYWSSFFLYIVGVEFVVLPIVMPVITGKTKEMYSKPAFPILIASGVVLYFAAKKLIKTLDPKEYDLTSDWRYEVRQR